jgi:DNA modification methylase
LSTVEVKALFETSLKRTLAFAERGAVCYATVPSGPLASYFIATFEDPGLLFKHLLIWAKQHFVIGTSDYEPKFEPILYGWLENGPHYFIDDRTRSSVIEIDRPLVSDLNPTTRPVLLIVRLITNRSRLNEIIYDPFCGSGTTIVAVHQLARIAYGCEIDAAYLAVELERLSLVGL